VYLCTDNGVQAILYLANFTLFCKTWWRICIASHCLQLS